MYGESSREFEKVPNIQINDLMDYVSLIKCR
jgi:hypothetical protein